MILDLAGPVEFSTADILVIVLVVAAVIFALPLVAGIATFAYYRRRVTTVPDGPSPLARAGIAFAATFGAQLAALWIVEWIRGLVNG